MLANPLQLAVMSGASRQPARSSMPHLIMDDADARRPESLGFPDAGASA